MGGELGVEETSLKFGGYGIGDGTDEEWNRRFSDCYFLC